MTVKNLSVVWEGYGIGSIEVPDRMDISCSVCGRKLGKDCNLKIAKEGNLKDLKLVLDCACGNSMPPKVS